jgi:hypothetical protein
MLYGGKNKNPKRVVFLQVKDIVAMLDERFSATPAKEASILETEYEINFPHISTHWRSLPVFDEQKRKTRVGAVLRACRFMEHQRLLLILDEGREVRPTERLDDLMIAYYLDMRRIAEIHQLFDSLEGVEGAKAQQD